jgi:hypothetical protein
MHMRPQGLTKALTWVPNGWELLHACEDWFGRARESV